MKSFTFKDCYYSYGDDVLIIGNGTVERKLIFYNGLPFTEYILNKATGYRWGKKDTCISVFNNSVLNFKETQIGIMHSVDDRGGLSARHLLVEVVLEEGHNKILIQFIIYPGTPFISSYMFIQGKSSKLEAGTYGQKGFEGQENRYSFEAGEGRLLSQIDCIDAFCMENRHLKLEVIQLFDRTDFHDNLLTESVFPLYAGRESRHEGNLFILDSYLENEGLMIVKEGPMTFAHRNRREKELLVKAGEYVQLIGSGIDYENISEDYYTPCYGCTVGVGQAGTLKEAYKRLYAKESLGSRDGELFIMSNNWGDRSGDAVVCHDFMLKEIDAAAEIGVDIVQLDDGWQTGVTSNSKLGKSGVWEGYYDFDSRYWEVNAGKFPEGLEPIVAYARERGIRIGLWFSPDSSDSFKNWEKDAEVLLGYYKKYGICHFKQDGIKVRDKQGERNLLRMLERVSRESGGQVTFNMDVTAEERFGYLGHKQYGTIFVENRYTDWANYYPHNTLKNLWCLSKVIIPRRLQMEVLNNRRNTDKYNDILAPEYYTIDYEFAAVMVSNPLIWMEMSNLLPGDRECLAGIVCVYKQHRKALFGSEVYPIGDKPDGVSFTGFQAKLNEAEGYLILFREFAQEKQYTYFLNGLAGEKLSYEFLYANNEKEDYSLNENLGSSGELEVKFEKSRSYIFVKYRRK